MSPFDKETEDLLGPLLAMNGPYKPPMSTGALPDIQADQPPEVMASQASPMAASQVDAETAKPDVNAYIAEKYNIKKPDSGPNWMAGLAALGAGLQGQNAFAAGEAYKKGQREQAEFDEKEARKIRESDLNSQETLLARTLAKKMVPTMDFSKMTAVQINERIPALTKIYDIEQQKLNREEQRDFQRSLLNERRAERGDAKRQKLEEKEFSLKTPYGLANTEDDAKKLKDAFEAKQNFNSKIQEMIDLRKQYGAEYMNREAVARGKQLSKDLLLEYKNMAKLGVLSQADQAIIDAIIPADPLGHDWAPGQDPILSNLEKFKSDSDKDFATRVKTRTREGANIPSDDADSQSAARRKRIAELKAKMGAR